MHYNVTFHVKAEAFDSVSIRDGRELFFQVLSPTIIMVITLCVGGLEERYIPRNGLRANGDADTGHPEGEEEQG